MTDGIKETPRGEQQQERLTVDVGEWFRPFEGYSELPGKYGKSFPFDLRGVGEFNAHTSQVGKGFFTRQTSAVVMFPDKDSQLDLEDLKKLETEAVKIYSTPAFGKFTDTQEGAGEEVPYIVELRSPAGNTYTASFNSMYSSIMNGPNDDFEITRHAENFDPGKKLIIAPETDFVLEQIEIRMIPKAGDQR